MTADDASEFRGWYGGVWFDGVELPPPDRLRELGRLVADEGWSLEEALCAVEPPSWWPADDPGRDLEREPIVQERIEYEIAAHHRCGSCGVVLGDPGLQAVGYCSSECEHANREAGAS